MENITWCTACGARFTEEEIVNALSCPKCGTKSLPCDADDDFLIEVNWHELKILCNWAKNYANEHCDKQANRTLRAIIYRLEKQNKKAQPLTLAGEIMELRQEGYDIKTNVPAEDLIIVNGLGAIGHGKKPNE